MSSGKQTPRAKMIGMMYLVLTALLALNVSKDILNAFVIVNKGLETTTESFGQKNDVTYKAFDFALKNDKNKVQDFYDKAQKAKSYSNELVKYIEDLKKELYMKVDGLAKNVADTTTLEYVNSKDNMDIPGEILIGSTADGAKGKARLLKLKLDDYNKNMLALLKEKIDLGIDTKDPAASAEEGTQSWETHHFDHTPFAAVITLLSKLQSDVKNAEADVINNLFSNISQSDFKFDALAARVVAPNSYILSGNEYTADIFVSAFSTTLDPVIEISPNGQVDTVKNVVTGKIDNSNLKIDKGMGKYTVRTSAEGPVKWGGVIKVKSPDGSFKPYSFKSEYLVAKPAAVVSADKMNVLYIGVDNPMSISVAGVPSEKVKPSITGGTLSPGGGKGKYLSRVTAPGKAIVSVSAEVGGKLQPMGSMEYRIKYIPDPVAKVANMKGGNISKAVLQAQGGVIPTLEDFVFDLNFVVTAFSMTRSGKGIDPKEVKSTSNLITQEMKDMIKASRTGDKIYFEGIRAKGPDGRTRDLGSLSFTVQ